MTQKTIIILLAIIAVFVPVSVNAMLESWMGVDCTSLGSSGMIPICNDINDLNYRLSNLENDHVIVIELDTLHIPINIPFVVDGFTANVNYIDWTNRIVLQISAPNNTIIYSGPQPTTFTPDRNGAWNIEAYAGNGTGYWQVYTNDGPIPIIDLTLNIIQIDDGDYLQINATGFYPNDEITWYVPDPLWHHGDVLADSEGKISVLSENLKLYLFEETTLNVEVHDKPTSTKTFGSILYEVNNDSLNTSQKLLHRNNFIGNSS